MKGITRIVTVLLAISTLVTVTACGTATAADNGKNTDGTQTVNVGTMGTYSPYSYQDEQGNYTGYDLEVVKKIGEIDKGLKFEIKAGSWDSLFPALDAGKDQMLAQQIVSTPERESKYYLTKTPYFLSTSQIIAKKGTTGVNSLKDLKGKTIGMTVGDGFTKFVDDWNAKNGNILTIKYYKEDITTILRDIAAGRIDATVNDPAVAVSKAKLQGIEVEPIGKPLEQQPTYFIFKKNEQGKQLRDRVDKALQKLSEDGTLSELSIKWFKKDYTKKNS